MEKPRIRGLKVAVVTVGLTMLFTSVSVAGLSPLGERVVRDVCGGELACIRDMARKFEERCANARVQVKKDPSTIVYYRGILDMCDCSVAPVAPQSTYGVVVDEGSLFERKRGEQSDSSDDDYADLLESLEGAKERDDIADE